MALTLWALGASAGPARAEPPSVLVVITDDQRPETLWAMPTVQRELVARGVTFANAFVVNALCCPSRASLLTGNYSHTTGVYRQRPPYGRAEAFDDGSTLATWLQDAGYTTGFFGKYLDGFQHQALTGYVPPGWDRFVAFVHAEYLDYGLTVDGAVRRYGSAPEDYSTDVLAEAAVSFIRQSRGPLFVVYAPAAPHGPAIPASPDAAAFADLPAWRPPGYDEADVSDKPAYIRALPRLDVLRARQIDQLRVDQYRTLLSVDRAVARLLQALAATGRLDHTLVVLTSDNGLAWGEHRWWKKEVPYEESIRVPLVVRYDPLVGAARTESRLALNIDLAPTVAEVAGVATPPTDGRSLVPLLAGRPVRWRRDFLVEHLEGRNPVPTYCAVRGERFKYVRYATGEEELYDLAADPHELENRAADPRLARVRAAMDRRLGQLCQPPPPGFGGPDAARAWAGLGVLGVLLVAEALRGRRFRPRWG